MRKERVLFWFMAVLIVGGTVFALAKLPKKETGQPNSDIIELSPIIAADWVIGNKESQNTLMEYGDFQCPACAAYKPLVDQLLKEQGANFRFVYRHFPLRQHFQAKDAAYAAEAAGKQGKFWTIYDLIYKYQTDWAEKTNAKNIFLDYVSSLGLNLEQFKKDRDLAEIKNRIEKDIQEGLKIGINSTPTFYLNGKKIQPRSYEEFSNLIKQSNVTPTPSTSPQPITSP